MGKKSSNIIIRLIPTIVVLGIIITLSFYWSQDRDGAFYYFLVLMAYACVMLFFSDIIFLGGKRPIHARIPVTVVATVHIVYVLLILLFRAVFNLFEDIYFVLATILATCAQVTISLLIYRSILNITKQQEELDQGGNIRVGRDIILMDLADSFKNIPVLSKDTEVMRKLEVFCNTWKASSDKDNPATVQLTNEINYSIQSLTNTITSGEAEVEAETVTGEIARISSLIERRKKLLNLKQTGGM